MADKIKKHVNKIDYLIIGIASVAIAGIGFHSVTLYNNHSIAEDVLARKMTLIGGFCVAIGSYLSIKSIFIQSENSLGKIIILAPFALILTGILSIIYAKWVQYKFDNIITKQGRGLITCNCTITDPSYGQNFTNLPSEIDEAKQTLESDPFSQILTISSAFLVFFGILCMAYSVVEIKDFLLQNNSSIESVTTENISSPAFEKSDIHESSFDQPTSLELSRPVTKFDAEFQTPARKSRRHKL